MDDRDKLLETLGFDVSDGREPDWSSLEATADDSADREMIRNLRSLSLMANFYRELRQEDQAIAGESPDRAARDGSEPDQAHPPWGHLEILERIGRGTYGDIYLARDTSLNREVALKLIRGPGREETSRPNFLREAENLARVKHPNLVTIHGAEVRDGDLGLWMEYIQGVTLHDLVAEQGPLSGREATLVGIDLCGALAALHSAGLLHRDIKAHNVMREEGGRVVLMDLGSGSRIPDAADSLSGTPLYMAPEVMAGQKATTRADIYSLGVLLYHAVTGAYPVTAQALADLRAMHVNGEHRHLRDARPDLPAAFVRVIERAITPDPGQRFGSAGEMELALAGALSSAEKPEEEPESPAVPGASASRLRLPLILLAAAATFVVAVVLFVWPGVLLSPSYTVSAALYRAGESPREELLPGARVAPGDRLFLNFEASREMYVYVLAEDEMGEAYLLFPIPGQIVTNPLVGDLLHRLPPDQNGRSYSWGVSSAGGTEHLLIVASPDPLSGFEQTLAALPAPRQPEATPAIPLDQEALRNLRGIGHLLMAQPNAEPGVARTAFEMARSLAAGPERSSGVWIRQIDLINPGP